MPSEVLTLNGRNSLITTCTNYSLIWEVDVKSYMDMDKAETIFGQDIMEIYFTRVEKTSEPIIGKYYQTGSGEYYIVSDDGIYYLDSTTLTKLKPNSIIQILNIQQDEYHSYKMLKVIAK